MARDFEFVFFCDVHEDIIIYRFLNYVQEQNNFFA